jgi:alkanesulfonate monooxygenase SsuD/methylene tetrahydromethanopterin reductase-like flavin-dependent oxidoreductase (luciferase family)
LKYGLELPTGHELADPVVLADLAQLAERRGWDGVFLEDYVCYAGDPRTPTVDTWVALAAIATATERIVLGTAVTALPRRRPWNVARQAVAIDRLSGGRLVLGAGLGDTGESVVADASLLGFGEERDVRVRAEMLDEALEIISGLWTGESFTFSGRHYSIDEVTFQPTAVQRPRIPIWIGGVYPKSRPTRRALRWDGSLLYRDSRDGPSVDLTPDDVVSLAAAAAGRPFDIAVGGNLDRPEREQRAWAAAMRDAGATWCMQWLAPAPLADIRRRVDRGPTRAES